MSVRRIRVVSGATTTGLAGANGTVNVVKAPSPVVGMVGLYHPCGAYYVTVANDTLDKGTYAKDGSLYVTETLTNHNGPQRVIVVSGSLGSAGDHVNPVITSDSTKSVAEGNTLSISLTADTTVTWSIAGGNDASLFEISTSTLRWKSNGHQTFATPLDANKDNIYEVSVRATDTNGNYITQAISVTVTETSSFTGPLDIVSGAVVAVGQRALSAASRGSAVYTVRRSSDSTTQAFSSDATSGAVSQSSVSSFIGGGSGFVTQWTNEGTGGNLVQVDTAKQPTWQANVSNSKPGISGSDAFINLQSPEISWAGGGMTVFAVVDWPDTGPAPSVWAIVKNETGNSITTELFDWYNTEGDVGVYIYHGNGTAGGEWASAGTYSVGTHIFEFLCAADGAVTVLVDGVDAGMTLQFGSQIAIEPQTSLFQFPYGLGGGIGLEAIVYESILSSGNRTSIRQNMATYYGITLG